MNIYSKIIQYRQRIVSILFSTAAIVLGALVATGFRFTVEVFTTWSFYVKTGINYAIMIVVYNSVKQDFIRTEKLSEKNKLYENKKRTNRFVKIVRDEHLEDLISDEADKETERRRIGACNRELNKYTYGLELREGVIDYGYVKDLEGKPHKLTEEEFYQTRHLKERQIKKVKKSIQKALNSQVAYAPVTAYEILTGYQGANGNHEDPIMSINENKENIKESNKKTLVFILTAAVTNVIVWSSIDAASFWAMLLAHLTLILSSVLTAITSAYNRIETLTQIEVNRSSFLNQAIPFEVLQKYNDNNKKETPKEEKQQEEICNVTNEALPSEG